VLDKMEEEIEEITSSEPQTVIMTRQYIANLKHVISFLKKQKPEDRLGYANAIAICLNGMILSVGGWNAWLANLQATNNITLEEFKYMYPKIKRIAIEFLEIDINITSKKVKETAKKLKEQKITIIKHKDKTKTTYVA